MKDGRTKDLLGDYQKAKKLCMEKNCKLSYEQMRPCALKGKHDFTDYDTSRPSIVATCGVCGWKQVVDGNM